MKKVTYFLLVGLMICTTACDKDNDEPKPEPPQYGIVSKIDIRYSDTDQYSLEMNVEYDTQNNITKIQCLGYEEDDDQIFSYKREGDKLTITETDEQDKVRTALKANLDAKGQIITAEYLYDKDGEGTIQNLKCQYADNGDLVFCTDDYNGSDESECKFTWSNGNIVKNEALSIDDDGDIFHRDTWQQYSSIYENRTNFDFSDVLSLMSDYPLSILSLEALYYMQLRTAGYLGNKDKYLPAKIVWIPIDHYSAVTEYLYEFNDDGLPNTIVVKLDNNGSQETVTMHITYKK